MHKLVLRRIGRSLGVTLPPEMVEEMGLTAGDTLFLVNRDDGYAIVPGSSDFGKTLGAFNEVRREYRNAFHELSG